MRDVHKLRRTWVACMEELGGPGNGEHACSIYSIQAKNIFPEKGGFECNGGAKREGNKWHFVQQHYICVERTCACIAMVTVVWQQILILHAILNCYRKYSDNLDFSPLSQGWQLYVTGS